MEDLHLRASAYGMPGVKVDGMDVDAVMAATSKAVDRARSGGGPTLIEAKTYRFAGHSRADAATYRPSEEVEEWRKRDPLILTRRSIIAKGLADAAALDDLDESIRADIAKIVMRVQELPGPAIEAMFGHVWHDSTIAG
jgi:pyruvate dehydrogenase E1 component alpha subunit